MSAGWQGTAQPSRTSLAWSVSPGSGVQALASHRTRTIAAMSPTLRAHRLALYADQIDERLFTLKSRLNRRPDRTHPLGETRALLTTLVAPERHADLTELAPHPSRQCKERQT